MSHPAILLLASGSPRRQQLLALSGWSFRTAASNLDESRTANESPQGYVLRMAEAKARAAAAESGDEQIVIGADTIVVDGDHILGKPASTADAVNMLRRLRGHSHKVYSGIAALRVRDGKLITDLCITDVPMRSYSDEEIEAYVRSSDPFDKAGAYAIQDPGFNPVEKMAGCYAGVMGLPLCHLVRTLGKLGLPSPADVPMNCQAFLQYDCPVSPAILREAPRVQRGGSGEQVG